MADAYKAGETMEEKPVIEKKKLPYMRWSLFDASSTYKCAWSEDKRAHVALNVLRLAGVAYFFSTMTASNVFFDQGPLRTMSYLTNWGVWALCVYLGLAGVGGLVDQLGCARGCCVEVMREGWSNFRKTVIVMFQLVFCFEVCITIMYWLMLFDYSRNAKELEFFYSFNHHATALVMIGIDLGLGTHFVYFRHVSIGLVVAVVYSLWNMIFTLASGYPVYDILTWEDAGSFILVIVTLLLLVGAYALGHYLSKSRDGRAVVKFLLPSKEESPRVSDIEMGSGPAAKDEAAPEAAPAPAEAAPAEAASS